MAYYIKPTCSPADAGEPPPLKKEDFLPFIKGRCPEFIEGQRGFMVELVVLSKAVL